MTPDTLYLLICAGFAVAGWFVHHVWPGDASTSTAPATQDRPLLAILGQVLHTHVQNQAPGSTSPTAEEQLAALLAQVLTKQSAPAPMKPAA